MKLKLVVCVVARYWPVVMTGDFNMEPQSPLYRLMLTGQLSYTGLVSQHISGQDEEDEWGGRRGGHKKLCPSFFSPKYGVTDYCQYIDQVQARVQQRGQHTLTIGQGTTHKAQILAHSHNTTQSTDRTSQILSDKQNTSQSTNKSLTNTKSQNSTSQSISKSPKSSSSPSSISNSFNDSNYSNASLSELTAAKAHLLEELKKFDDSILEISKFYAKESDLNVNDTENQQLSEHVDMNYGSCVDGKDFQKSVQSDSDGRLISDSNRTSQINVDVENANVVPESYCQRLPGDDKAGSSMDPASLEEPSDCEYWSQFQKRFPAMTDMPSNTGHLKLPLTFNTAYTHFIERTNDRSAEITTHHNAAACTVDYVFYTVTNKQLERKDDKVKVKSCQEGELKLLGRYGLLSAVELGKKGGIPCKEYPSDHLCLITKFLLT